MSTLKSFSTTAENKEFVGLLKGGLLVRWLDESCRRDPRKAWRSVDMYENLERYYAKMLGIPKQMTPQRKFAFLNVLAATKEFGKLKGQRRGESTRYYTKGLEPLDGLGDVRTGDWDKQEFSKLHREIRGLMDDFMFQCVNVDLKQKTDIRWSCDGVYRAFETWTQRREGRPQVLNSHHRRTVFFTILVSRLGVKRKRLWVKTETSKKRVWAYPGIEPRKGALDPSEPWWKPTEVFDDIG